MSYKSVSTKVELAFANSSIAISCNLGALFGSVRALAERLAGEPVDLNSNPEGAGTAPQDLDSVTRQPQAGKVILFVLCRGQKTRAQLQNPMDPPLIVDKWTPTVDDLRWGRSFYVFLEQHAPRFPQVYNGDDYLRLHNDWFTKRRPPVSISAGRVLYILSKRANSLNLVVVQSNTTLVWLPPSDRELKCLAKVRGDEALREEEGKIPSNRSTWIRKKVVDMSRAEFYDIRVPEKLAEFEKLLETWVNWPERPSIAKLDRDTQPWFQLVKNDDWADLQQVYVFDCKQWGSLNSGKLTVTSMIAPEAGLRLLRHIVPDVSVSVDDWKHQEVEVKMSKKPKLRAQLCLRLPSGESLDSSVRVRNLAIHNVFRVNKDSIEWRMSHELASIVTLVGPPGTGKSSIMRAVQFFTEHMPLTIDSESSNCLHANEFPSVWDVTRDTNVRMVIELGNAVRAKFQTWRAISVVQHAHEALGLIFDRRYTYWTDPPLQKVTEYQNDPVAAQRRLYEAIDGLHTDQFRFLVVELCNSPSDRHKLHFQLPRFLTDDQDLDHDMSSPWPPAHLVGKERYAVLHWAAREFLDNADPISHEALNCCILDDAKWYKPDTTDTSDSTPKQEVFLRLLSMLMHDCVLWEFKAREHFDRFVHNNLPKDSNIAGLASIKTDVAFRLARDKLRDKERQGGGGQESGTRGSQQHAGKVCDSQLCSFVFGRDEVSSSRKRYVKRRLQLHASDFVNLESQVADVDGRKGVMLGWFVELARGAFRTREAHTEFISGPDWPPTLQSAVSLLLRGSFIFVRQQRDSEPAYHAAPVKNELPNLWDIQRALSMAKQLSGPRLEVLNTHVDSLLHVKCSVKSFDERDVALFLNRGDRSYLAADGGGGEREAVLLLMALAPWKGRDHGCSVFLDEPGYNMGSDALAKLSRDLAKLPHSILIVTHSPAMVTEWTLPGLLPMTPGGATAIDERHHPDILLHPEILFASRVMFVEGSFDRRLVDHLLQHLVAKFDQHRVARVTVVQMDGSKNSPALVCKALDTRWMLMVDVDTILPSASNTIYHTMPALVDSSLCKMIGLDATQEPVQQTARKKSKKSKAGPKGWTSTIVEARNNNAVLSISWNLVGQPDSSARPAVVLVKSGHKMLWTFEPDESRRTWTICCSEQPLVFNLQRLECPLCKELKPRGEFADAQLHESSRNISCLSCSRKVQLRKCPCCNKDKSVNEFSESQLKKGRKKAKCSTCAKAAQAQAAPQAAPARVTSNSPTPTASAERRAANWYLSISVQKSEGVVVVEKDRGKAGSWTLIPKEHDTFILQCQGLYLCVESKSGTTRCSKNAWTNFSFQSSQTLFDSVPCDVDYRAIFRHTLEKRRRFVEAHALVLPRDLEHELLRDDFLHSLVAFITRDNVVSIFNDLDEYHTKYFCALGIGVAMTTTCDEDCEKCKSCLACDLDENRPPCNNAALYVDVRKAQAVFNVNRRSTADTRLGDIQSSERCLCYRKLKNGPSSLRRMPFPALQFITFAMVELHQSKLYHSDIINGLTYLSGGPTPSLCSADQLYGTVRCCGTIGELSPLQRLEACGVDIDELRRGQRSQGNIIMVNDSGIASDLVYKRERDLNPGQLGQVLVLATTDDGNILASLFLRPCGIPFVLEAIFCLDESWWVCCEKENGCFHRFGKNHQGDRSNFAATHDTSAWCFLYRREVPPKEKEEME